MDDRREDYWLGVTVYDLVNFCRYMYYLALIGGITAGIILICLLVDPVERRQGSEPD